MPSQHRPSRYHFWGVLFSIGLTAMLWLGPLRLKSWQVGLVEMVAARPAASQLVQEGIERYQEGDFQAAIQFWETALIAYQHHDRSEDEATVLKYLMRADRQVGRIDRAIAHSEQAVVYYSQMKNPQQLERMLTEQAQLYGSLGQQKRAIAILCGQNSESACSQDSALEIARRQSDDLGEVAALGSLGNAYRLQGEYDRAIRYLEQSLEIAKKTGDPYVSAAFNGLANTYSSVAKRDAHRAQLASIAGDRRAQKFRQDAFANDGRAAQYFEDSLRLARIRGDRLSELRSLLSLLPYHRRQATALANETLQQALVILEQLPDSRDKAYVAIKLADLIQLVTMPTDLDLAAASVQCQSESAPQSVALLNKAVAIAQRLQDRQAESFAFGRLGHLYECRQDYKQALIFTQQAQLASDANSLYLWEWQAGRIFRARGQMNEAIDAYEASVKTLKSIRTDLALASRELQFDFRDTVEPVYREAIELILDRTLEASSSLLNKEDKGTDIQARLQAVLETVDDLRLAELQNYLGGDCTLSPIEKPVALIDRSTAVFSSIVLKDRIAIILTLPDGEKKLKSQVHLVPIESQEVVKVINDLRFKLEDRSDLENTFSARSQQVYDWFIRPFASELDRKKIETLVFIQDGIWRSIPTAALYDGKQFLVQKYAIANTPSLTLTNPTQLTHKDLRVLAFGLTQSATVDTIDGQTFFGPLSQVKTELGSIKTAISDSKSLLNENFTADRLKQELEKNTYPIIHLATHGKFGFDAKETFLVTGQLVSSKNQNLSSQRYNEKLTIDDLYQIITSTRQRGRPIELLTLSACETAVGSDRDALGIAGISLQAGSQSAMASLWGVDDKATAQLISKFYQGLREGLSRAKALQTAQKAAPCPVSLSPMPF